MSGIVGILNLDGAPVDGDLLRRMTELLAYRGPDRQETWQDGCVGFGHTLLRTAPESLHERQPLSLDGQVWMVADARVDGRTDLLQALSAHGRVGLGGEPDAALLLHAYHVWGDDCVHYLIGDFAFAVWDVRRRRLFCARDHFGVKPLYYSHMSDCLLFSNTLNCLRTHPSISGTLNDLAVADFLLFAKNQEPATTTFADIQRLPAGHVLTWSDGMLRLERYWSLPVDGRIRYKRVGDYVDHFRSLLRTAVADRLRTDRIGIFMSGGLDSTSVAATAHDLLSPQDGAALHAFTGVYSRMIPDEERHFSGIVAERLGIPAHYLVADDYRPYERWDTAALRLPEPGSNIFQALASDLCRQSADHGRVVLTGHGFDPALRLDRFYFLDVMEQRRYARLAADVGRILLASRRLPRIGLRTGLRRWRGQLWRPEYPNWLNPDLARRLDLPKRFEATNNPGASLHPVRAEAYRDLTNPGWPALFERNDPGVTRWPVEFRYPAFDVRLLSFLLALPPVPFFWDKWLLREAMRGSLPEPVRLRPKTPVVADQLAAHLEQDNGRWAELHDPAHELATYVDVQVARQSTQRKDPATLVTDLRTVSLNYWLKYSVNK